ncbi:hypothetical protein TSUD_150750 [Trifolium subterraneum]|uniref:TF-B3 domain-containing protein n=1 Tax=Trifolium subterraneum TaxID=3900 RepID=A0A2Z6M0J3_TRISU|nr:hypothetical protein TSUD_150750 [Trifolium subterraneum]
MADEKCIDGSPMCELFSVVRLESQVSENKYHSLRFNNDYQNPLILNQGWNKLKEFHEFPDNVELEFKYHGDNIYEIMSFRNLSNAAGIPAFHKFLHKTGWESINLCGDNGTRWSMHILNINDLHRMKLGYCWDEFCNNQGFKAGERLRFKFEKDVGSVRNRCHIFKV